MRSYISDLHGRIAELSGVSLAAGDWAPTPQRSLGEFAIPCFKLAQALKKKPAEVATELATQIQGQLKATSPLSRVVAAGPYINAFINIDHAYTTLRATLARGPQEMGATKVGAGKNLVIDFSSPNVAKEMALHHLRSTAIGNALARIAKLHGYSVTRINYLGDWGTSFGKYIVALKLYGDEAKLKAGGLSYMLELYVRINKEAKDNPELNQAARAAFKKLEDGDPESRRLWLLFRETSVTEFKALYRRLGIEFDHYDSESLYEGVLENVVKEIDAKIGTHISEGALVCELPGHKIPILLKKDDGASLYITRDVAAIEDRYQRFAFDLNWYVVAVQQKLHFQQLFDLVAALKKPYAGKSEHIPFGMLSFGAKTMKTREGNIIFLEDVLDEAKQRALDIIQAKNPELANAEAVAEMIGRGAILFTDLSQNRTGDVSFSWEKALSFEGDTAPFIQYTHARCQSLLRRSAEHFASLKADRASVTEILNHEAIRQLIGDLWFFEIYSERALANRDPAQIATAVLNIAKSMSQFYHKIRFLDEGSHTRLDILLRLTEATRSVLAQGLDLLGIEAPTEM